jgi:isoleucyl-tRNA synthetase
MAVESTFEALPESTHFPTEELTTLEYWKEIDAFKECLRQSEGKPQYIFYDGPPFATGLPHYGHILAGTIKDVVTRFAHQRGYHVERKWGWDCHGLPVEHEIDKKLNIKGREDVMKMGIGVYNEECRAIVQRFTAEWRKSVERFGRWIDMDNDYKTMDLYYMESCWWVVKELFDKGLIYRAPRVMPFSTACCTPLSNFEVALNYKEVNDPSIIVQFKMVGEKDSYFLAWTTTPWTLPSNLALCVNPALTYLHVKNKESGVEWVLGKDRWAWILSSIKKDASAFEVLKECLGKDLAGKQYEPLFDYFKDKVIKDKVWRILTDGYVSTDAGTCIVHQAPAFGEDDNRVCRAAGIVQKDGTGMVCPVNDSGCYTSEVYDFVGQHVKEADNGIKAKLKQQGALVFNGTERHNYPHCPRSDTPLIYKAIHSWFVKVEDYREKFIKNNDQTYWVPQNVKEKRFHNWLAEARDWCFSRNRYWGTPIPIWVSEDFEEMVCIGSVAELEKYTNGKKITDIHRHFIDDIEIPSQKGKGMLRRVDEVLDCWFESGSMPYASKHYPFENKDSFSDGFPAQFIAEGLDQTRGWFYTLMVLSSHLFDKPPFYNVVVNGLVLAADGKKMSKRLKNYPDPTQIVKDHGADAVRMYLCNSPVVRAEPLKFKEDGVKGVVKEVLLPWYNAYRFLVQEVARYESSVGKFVPNPALIKTSTNFMDKWINAGMHGLIKFVREEMEAYRLYTVAPRLVQLLEDLTNWYVRLNRDRMRGNSGPDEALLSLCTLYDVLLNACILLAPLTPFITEMIYKNLSRALPDGHDLKKKSVHWVMIPHHDPEALSPETLLAVERLQSVVQLGRTCRERKKVGQRTPLKGMTLLNKSEAFMNDVKSLEAYLKEELNVMQVTFSQDTSKVVLAPTLNFKLLGKKCGKDMKKVQEALKEVTQEQLQKFDATGVLNVGGYDLLRNDEDPELSELSVTPKVKDLEDVNFEANGNQDSLVILDFTPDEDLGMMACSRSISNCVQTLRKEAKLQQNDAVEMWATVAPSPKKSSGYLSKVLSVKKEYIESLLRRPLSDAALLQGHEVVIKSVESEIAGCEDKIVVSITAAAPFFNPDAVKKLTGGDDKADFVVRQYLATCSLKALVEAKEKPVEVNYADKKFVVKCGEHWALSPTEAPWIKPK